MALEERARREAQARAAEAKKQAEESILGAGVASSSPPPPPPPPPLSPTPAANIPPPRVMRQATVRLHFTPRAFPTPARESKAAEEEDWLARNGRHRRPGHSSVPPTNASNNVEGGAESHPVWLKARGDELFKTQDFEGALNAYAACLAADPDHGGALANRAACHLKLGRLDDCVDDCTRALGLLKEDESGGGGSGKARQRRLLTRRGAAHYEAGRYAKALEDYRAALELGCVSEGGDEGPGLAKDVARVQELVASSAAEGVVH
jgi:dyslexia susceptibility 1 candidate gene 1 protein